jgi:transcriptional regulator with XRE-family HTH domain
MDRKDKPAKDSSPRQRRELHRLSIVRKLRKLTLNEVARQLQLPYEEARRQEQETSDLALSQLYRWQRLLQVPIADLLVDGDESLGVPAVKKEALTAVLEVALQIIAHTRQPGIRRIAHTLVDQLVELSPELKPIADAHTAGQAHLFDEQGRALKGALPVDFFLDPIE